MAITKIWPVKSNQTMSVESSLNKINKYVTDQKKTELPIDSLSAYASASRKTGLTINNRKDFLSLKDLSFIDEDNVMTLGFDPNDQNVFRLVTGINCSPESATEQFINTKKCWGKGLEGRVVYHAIQSFDKGEVNPVQAHAIGVELAQRMWGLNYEVVVCTHLDTGTIHNHFQVNNVSFRDGKMFACLKSDYRRFVELSDEICYERNLSVIANPSGRGKSYLQALTERDRVPSRKEITKVVLDDALQRATSLRELAFLLNLEGYYFNFSSKHKYWTIQARHWKKPMRIMRLGNNYDNKNIIRRLNDSKSNLYSGYRFKTNTKKDSSYYKKRHRLINNKNGFRSLSNFRVRFYFITLILGGHPRKKRVFPKSYYRSMDKELFEEAAKLHMIEKELHYLFVNKISSSADLLNHLTDLNKSYADIKTKLSPDLSNHDNSQLIKKQNDLLRQIKITKNIIQRSAKFNYFFSKQKKREVINYGRIRNSIEDRI